MSSISVAKHKENGYPIRDARFVLLKSQGIRTGACKKSVRWTVFPRQRSARRRANPYSAAKENGYPISASPITKFYVRGGVTEKATLPFAIHTAIFLPLHLPCRAMQSSSLMVGRSMMQVAL